MRKVALLGNPNVGKSSLFNRLTGLNQRVGNYPGTTVDKKIGKISDSRGDIRLYDYPGTYSLYPKSADEEVVFDILSHPQHPDHPDMVYVVMHPVELKRSLLLYTQVADLGIPVRMVMNMVDEGLSQGVEVDTHILQDISGHSVFVTNARSGKGVQELKNDFWDESMTQPKSFFTPPIDFQDKLQQVKDRLSLDTDYLAWQYMLQPHIAHIGKENNKWLNDFRSTNAVHGSRLQVQETVRRYEVLEPIIAQARKHTPTTSQSWTDRLDAVLTHPFLGYLVFFALLFLIFQAIFAWAIAPMDFIDHVFGGMQSMVHSWGEGPLIDLLADGIVPGIAGVVIFIPQITILIFFLLVIEESGYMSRVVMLMDKWMRTFGLNGKSVVPLMSGAACTIPAVMAARNIENVKERLITIMVVPFITCSARLPVYAVIIALVIPAKSYYGIGLQGLVLMGMYLIGIVAALVFAFFFKLGLKDTYKSYLIMELPKYKWPHYRNVMIGLKEKLSAFVFGAGKIILSVSILLWALSVIGINSDFRNAEQIVLQENPGIDTEGEEYEMELQSHKLENSLLGNLGKTFEPVFAPLGYDWKISIGILSSFVAREVFVGTMATIYSLDSETEESGIVTRMRQETREDGRPMYDFATGISILLFYAFAMQCVSTLAIVKRETKSWKWPVFQLVYMSVFAYFVAMLAYQFLS
ncbi:MAG: ferrous iron transport protein B [Weeksellaceae bacterium]|nr:ferrous iron transport protein B [Weeksellaceae bacterium]